ncbi:MAG TPA: lipoyl(octanoyl) transferase [Candidatus Sulfotelmatobacter sp.]|jgi:lipoyl(octanoyl) transferase
MISVVQLGTVNYAVGLRLQQQLVALRKEEKIGDILLLLEHTPVITLGRNAKAGNVIASPELLAQRGVELFECDRGGDVTFHGPGQLVGYPVFDLRSHARGRPDAPIHPDESKTRPLVPLRKTLGVIDFVRRLEEVLIRTCADFAIPGKRVAGLTGVWTDPDSSVPLNVLSSRAKENDPKDRSLQSRDLLFAGNATNTEAKLAAIGVHISRSVTSHGFALNVNTDLSYFNLIVPCGITSKPVTSMREQLGKPLDLNAVAESISRNFGTVFQSQILWVESLDALHAGDACSLSNP